MTLPEAGQERQEHDGSYVSVMDAGDIDCIELFDRNDDICGYECAEFEVDVYKSVEMIWQLCILEICKWQHVLH